MTNVCQKPEVSESAANASANARALHFGLADAEVIDEIRIIWPTGELETLTEVSVNQRLRVTEGEGE